MNASSPSQKFASQVRAVNANEPVLSNRILAVMGRESISIHSEAQEEEQPRPRPKNVMGLASKTLVDLSTLLVKILFDCVNTRQKMKGRV